MSNPKAQKAVALFNRIKDTSRVVELATIQQQIDNDPEYNALDKMNMGRLVAMRMDELGKGLLQRVEDEVLGRNEEPEEEDPLARIEATGDYTQQESHRLYQIFFAAAEGHPSLVKRNFEKYMDRVLAVMKLPEKYTALLQEWDDYEIYGKKLTLEDAFYWSTDHMTILPNDIKRVQDRAEEEIRKYYRDDDVDWGFLDLVRRTLHAIELMTENYDEIRDYVDDAKVSGELQNSTPLPSSTEEAT